MRSGVSTIVTTTGKSSESRKILAVCRRLLAPNPMKPRSTEAPAKPRRRASFTISSYNGFPSC